MTTAIRHRVGTFRAAPPEVTWERIRSSIASFGITRVADITELDEIGLPTMIAYRPNGKTLVVSIGTGLSYAQARVSAVMENIELWHVENPVLSSIHYGPATDLGLPYDVRALNLAFASPMDRHCSVDWTQAAGLLSGLPVAVPTATVGMDFGARRGWSEILFHPTTNGVASGNTALEASLHGLFELVERECIADFLADTTADIRYADVEQVSSGYTRQILGAVRGAGCQIEAADITNRIGIPCYQVRIWSADVPIRSGGFGCHIDPDIALGRALAEAAQSRLAVVSGARDDIDSDAYRPGPRLREFHEHPASQRVDLRDRPDIDAEDLDSVVRHCATRVLEATGFEPFTLDLAHPEIGIAVQKVYAPGVRLFDHEVFRSRPGHEH